MSVNFFNFPSNLQFYVTQNKYFRFFLSLDGDSAVPGWMAQTMKGLFSAMGKVGLRVLMMVWAYIGFSKIIYQPNLFSSLAFGKL